MKEGQRVTYVTPHKCQHGIVKTIKSDNEVWVVYNLDGETWKYYNKYTGALTSTKLLVIGWLDLTEFNKLEYDDWYSHNENKTLSMFSSGSVALMYEYYLNH